MQSLEFVLVKIKTKIKNEMNYQLFFLQMQTQIQQYSPKIAKNHIP